MVRLGAFFFVSVWALGTAMINFGTSNANSPQQTLILVDSFTDYISGVSKSYCKEKGITLREFVSPYMIKVMSSRGSSVPSFMRAPTEGEESDWVIENGLSAINGASTCVVSESDAGIGTAERMQSVLGLHWNGDCKHVRNKYELIERVKKCGLSAVKQRLAASWDEAKDFLETELWSDNRGTTCVIKPYIGVASDGVHKCNSLEEAQFAFQKLFQSPQYGGGVNNALLIQEFVSGTEYAVDTVSRDGHVKIVALWKYHKMSANTAPFVYQCSELVPVEGPEAEAVCDYCLRVVESLGILWGPTHTEIMATSTHPAAPSPSLIEVNMRWHAQHFKPVVDRCIGYDAVTATMDSVFDPDKFNSLPDLPRSLKSAGLIIHLVSYNEGVIKHIHHLEEIASLSSTVHVSMDYEVGDVLKKTVDIRTDCGYVLLAHEDPEVVKADFNHIVALQKTMFTVEESAEVNESETGATVSKFSKKNPLQKPSSQPSSSPTTVPGKYTRDSSKVNKKLTRNHASKDNIVDDIPHKVSIKKTKKSTRVNEHKVGNAPTMEERRESDTPTMTGDALPEQVAEAGDGVSNSTHTHLIRSTRAPVQKEEPTAESREIVTGEAHGAESSIDVVSQDKLGLSNAGKVHAPYDRQSFSGEEGEGMAEGLREAKFVNGFHVGTDKEIASTSSTDQVARQYWENYTNIRDVISSSEYASYTEPGHQPNFPSRNDQYDNDKNAKPQQYRNLVPVRDVQGNRIVRVVHKMMKPNARRSATQVLLRSAAMAALLTCSTFALHLILALFVIPNFESMIVRQ